MGQVQYGNQPSIENSWSLSIKKIQKKKSKELSSLLEIEDENSIFYFVPGRFWYNEKNVTKGFTSSLCTILYGPYYMDHIAWTNFHDFASDSDMIVEMWVDVTSCSGRIIDKTSYIKTLIDNILQFRKSKRLRQRRIHKRIRWLYR